MSASIGIREQIIFKRDRRFVRRAAYARRHLIVCAQMSALRGRIRGDALLNKLIEFSQINRFNEMILESGLARLSDIFFHPKTR